MAQPPYRPPAKAKPMMPDMGDLMAAFQASGLKEKILFTLGAIAFYRLLVQVPVWGVDPSILKNMLGNAGGLGRMLDMFSGGALGKLSVIALGIGPYITASIIMQLMTVVVPRLEEMQKEEGEAGRKKISQMTRYLTVGLSLLQSALVLKLIGGAMYSGVDPLMFNICTVISLTAGSLFSLWLAETITERGIGNGGSLLILVGILSMMPFYIQTTFMDVSNDPGKSFALLGLLAVFVALIILIIILQEATRNIFVVNAKRQVGNKIYGGQNTHIPFKINPAGVMPIIFSFAVMAFPATIFGFAKGKPGTWFYEAQLFYQQWFSYTGPLYGAVMFVLVVFFTFFYASIVPSMQPREIAENLKKYGSAIPGIKPGRPTAEKLEEILTRVIWIGAFALAGITLISSYAPIVFNINTLGGLGATSLIIMVGVALDTVNQIRVHLLARQYEGFLK